MKTLTSIFLFLFSSLSAQTVMYQTMYGDPTWDYSATQIVPTSDGNFIICGGNVSATGNQNEVFVMKMEPGGDTLWTKSYGGSGVDFGWSISQSGAGYLVYASTTSFGSGLTDILSVTIDSDGDTVRSATYGGLQDDYCLEGNGLTVTPEGNFVFAGMTNTYGAGFFDQYLIKTDYTGSVIWSRTFGGQYSEQNGCFVATNDSGFACSGNTTSFGNGGSDFYLVKTDSLGNLMWSRTYGDTTNELGFGLIQTSDGGYLLTGMVLLTPTDYDIVVIRTDGMGNMLWVKQYGGNQMDWGDGAIEISTGGYLIYGRTTSFGAGGEDGWMMKIDTSGNMIWSNAYGLSASDNFRSAIETGDGGFMACGKGVPPSSNRNHVYVVKTDSNGNSGCYQTQAWMIVSTPSYSQITPNTIQGTGCTRVGDTLDVSVGSDITTLCTTVDINETVYTTVSAEIFPSPAVGSVTLRLNNSPISTDNSIIITNVLGQEISAIKNAGPETIIDIGNYAPGIYFCRLQNADGIIPLGEFIVN